MTAKEKAFDLCQQMGMTNYGSNYAEGYTLPLDLAKKCALIAVKEMLSYIAEIPINPAPKKRWAKMYWEDVKAEVNKL